MEEPMSEATTGMGAAEALTDLRGRVAIVTGANSGIGAAVAEALAERGTHVALAARREDKLREMADRLAAAAPESQTLVVPTDVRVPEQVEALVGATLDRWGKLDILIANAGFGHRVPIAEGDVKRWKDILDTNVYGLLLTLRYGVPPMLARHSGHVVVTSSIAGRVVTAGGGVYCGSKFAASAIAEALRMEVATEGVRVTTVEPGVVISDFQRVAEYSSDIVKNMLKGAEPLVPADIARAVVFALEQPAHVGIHELVVRPAGQVYP
jgi:NADP-dependent 3-hydroxy acid dehydrogenase YdfG